MSGRKLNPPDLPANERRSRKERKLLALSGGGYRGLFAATVIAELEALRDDRIAEHFDLIAGTSIGGIIAIGLACGKPAYELAGTIEELGSTIFQPKLTSFGGFSSSRYPNDGLKKVVNQVLTSPLAERPFSEIPVPLAVVAVEEGTSEPHIFRTRMAGGAADDTSTMEVALATSAAPTYFPPVRIGDQSFVDGGLIANAPDLIVLTEALKLFGCTIEECHVLSVGTAGSPRIGSVKGSPGKLGWIARHSLVELFMTAQEALAISEVSTLGPGTYLRIDRQPPNPISLDAIRPAVTDQLIGLAQEAVRETLSTRSSDWMRFVAHQAEWVGR